MEEDGGCGQEGKSTLFASLCSFAWGEKELFLVAAASVMRRDSQVYLNACLEPQELICWYCLLCACVCVGLQLVCFKVKRSLSSLRSLMERTNTEHDLQLAMMNLILLTALNTKATNSLPHHPPKSAHLTPQIYPLPQAPLNISTTSPATASSRILCSKNPFKSPQNASVSNTALPLNPCATTGPPPDPPASPFSTTPLFSTTPPLPPTSTAFFPTLPLHPPITITPNSNPPVPPPTSPAATNISFKLRVSGTGFLFNNNLIFSTGIPVSSATASLMSSAEVVVRGSEVRVRSRGGLRRERMWIGRGGVEGVEPGAGVVVVVVGLRGRRGGGFWEGRRGRVYCFV